MPSITEPPLRKRGRPRSFEDDPSDKVVQALDKGIIVLRAVSQSNGLSLTEASQLAELPAPTVYRSLVTMQLHGLVAFDERDQLWRIGVETVRIGSAFFANTGVAEQARPMMQRLMESTGETANFGVLSGDSVVFLGQVETHEPIRAFFRPGTRGSIHASGIGKALLAFRGEEEARKLVDTLELASFTSKTMTSPDALLQARRAMLRDGYSVDDEERTLGMRCVAAPIFNSFGEAIAAISVSGPSVRVSKDRLTSLGEQVRSTADEITRNVGGRPVSFE